MRKKVFVFQSLELRWWPKLILALLILEQAESCNKYVVPIFSCGLRKQIHLWQQRAADGEGSKNGHRGAWKINKALPVSIIIRLHWKGSMTTAKIAQFPVQQATCDQIALHFRVSEFETEIQSYSSYARHVWISSLPPTSDAHHIALHWHGRIDPTRLQVSRCHRRSRSSYMPPEKGGNSKITIITLTRAHRGVNLPI